jgi:hypothetical protein
MLDNLQNPSGEIGPALPSQPAPATPGGYAIAAFILGIVSFITCGPCAGIPALVLGLVELKKIRERSAPAEGKPFALAGAILGGINSALAILVLIFYLLFMALVIIMGIQESRF